MNAKKIIRENQRVVRICIIAAILLLSTPFIASAQCTVPANLYGSNLNLPNQELQCEIINSWLGLMPVAIIAVLLSFTIASFIFIIGVATKQDRIRNFGLGELYEATATALIVGFFFLIAGLAIQTLPITLINSLGAAGGVTTTATVTDPFVVATGDIANTVNTIEFEYDCVLNGYNNNNGQGPPPGIGVCQINSMNNIPPTNPSSYTWVTDFLSQKLQENVLNSYFGQFIQGGITYAFITIYAQQQLPEISIASYLIDGLYVLWGLYYLLIFFLYLSPVFIALGVVFRAILPTRALGGMLIAVGMGFYLVAPTLFAFLYSPNINPYPSNLSASACSGYVNPTTFTSSFICTSFGTILSVLNGLWLQVVFYPIIIIAITYTFVTQLANFIGASSQMGSRLRLGFI